MKIHPFEFTFTDSQVVLKNESEIEINPFGCYLVCGASGEGKSTFLKLLKGFYPDFLDGNLQGELDFFPNSHYLFQNPFTQLLHENVISEFMFSMENKKFTKFEMDQAKLWLEKFGLRSNKNDSTDTLSHGEAQRLLLASLVAAKPEWLFLDEPTAFLDVERRKDLYRLLGELKKNTGILLIDHHLNEVVPIVDGYFVIAKNNGVSNITFTKVQPSFAQEKREEIDFSKMPIQSQEIKIKIKNLNFSFKEKKIFSNFNSEFKTGMITTVVGKSGRGKSTLLKILADVFKVKNVTILFNEKADQDRLKYFSFLFQNPETHFLLDTVKEELDSFDFDDQFKNDLIKSLNLNLRLETNPFLLSEGEKRRLSLLMVMMMRKPFLLLDEPTFGQDLAQVEVIKKFIVEYKKKNYGIIMVSHDPEFYESISDQIIYLKDGSSHE